MTNHSHTGFTGNQLKTATFLKYSNTELISSIEDLEKDNDLEK